VRSAPAALTWAGCLLPVAALLPLPQPLRIVLAVAGVLLAWPLATLAWWAPRLPRTATDPVRPDARLFPAALLVLSALPLLLLAALGLAGVGLGTLLALFLAVPFAAAAFATVTGRPGGTALPSGARIVVATALGPVAGILLLALLHGAPLGTTDDAFDHVASLRTLMESGRVDFPGAHYAVDQPPGQDPRKGVLLVGLALAGRLAGADPLAVWNLSAVVLAPLMVLAYTSLALVLFGRSLAAFFGVALLVLFWGDPYWLLRGAYGGHWGLAIAWAGSALLLAGGGAGWGVAAGLATAAVHAYSPAQLLAPFLLLALVGMVLRRNALRLRAAGLAGVLAGALPVEVARKVLAGSAGNPLHEQSMGWLLLPPGPIASPLQLLGWYGYAGAVALLAIGVIAPFRRDRAGLFLLASATAPLLLLLNPFLFRPVAEWVGSLGNKLALAWAWPLAIAWIASVGMKERGKPVGVAALAAGVLLLGALALAAPHRFHAWRVGPPPIPERLESAMDLVRDHVPPGEAVLSDPATSYAIPALTGRPAIVTLHQHSPPGDRRSAGRLSVVAEVYSDCVPLGTSLARSREEGARFLLAATAATRRIDEYGSHSDPRNGARLEARFASRGDLLKPLARNGGGVLYAIVSPFPDGDPAGQERPGPSAASWRVPGQGGATPIYAPSPEAKIVSDGTVSLAVESIALRLARRGDRLSLPAAWRLEKPVDGYLEYSGHVRFENEALPPTAMPISLVSKPYRRLVLEPRAGGSYRWRAVELPFRGLCPVTSWPVGEWLPDTLDMVVPGSLLPGRYNLKISLERGTLYPALTLADLLMDNDRFSGPTAGALEIE
jgi:hypothetical protein